MVVPIQLLMVAMSNRRLFTVISPYETDVMLQIGMMPLLYGKDVSLTTSTLDLSSDSIGLVQPHYPIRILVKRMRKWSGVGKNYTWPYRIVRIIQIWVQHCSMFTWVHVTYYNASACGILLLCSVLGHWLILGWDIFWSCNVHLFLCKYCYTIWWYTIHYDHSITTTICNLSSEQRL